MRFLLHDSNLSKVWSLQETQADSVDPVGRLHPRASNAPGSASDGEPQGRIPYAPYGTMGTVSRSNIDRKGRLVFWPSRARW